jgi:hypothetical protein
LSFGTWRFASGLAFDLGGRFFMTVPVGFRRR